MTLLVHLGYLTYDFDTKTAWIPNKEGRQTNFSIGKKVLTKYCNCGKMRTKRNNVVAIQSRNKKAPELRPLGAFTAYLYEIRQNVVLLSGYSPAQPLVEKI